MATIRVGMKRPSGNKEYYSLRDIKLLVSEKDINTIPLDIVRLVS